MKSQWRLSRVKRLSKSKALLRVKSCIWLWTSPPSEGWLTRTTHSWFKSIKNSRIAASRFWHSLATNLETKSLVPTSRFWSSPSLNIMLSSTLLKNVKWTAKLAALSGDIYVSTPSSTTKKRRNPRKFHGISPSFWSVLMVRLSSITILEWTQSEWWRTSRDTLPTAVYE